MYHRSSKVLFNKEIAPGYYKLGLVCRDMADSAVPGQFLMIKVSEQLDPLLRRPFSIHKIHSIPSSNDRMEGDCRIEILYKVVGKGTGILSTAMKGNKVDLLGPMGNGFRIHKSMNTALLIAGGIGVAPLLSLAEKILLDHGETKSILLFLGGKGRNDILCEEDFERLGVKTHICTEDGSLGRKGLVTDTFLDYLESHDRGSESVPHCFVCGPEGMSREVAKIAHRKRIPCQISLETVMACGLGACLGCVVKTKPSANVQGSASGFNSHRENPMVNYKKVCRDGPVFDSSEIFWE